MDKKVITVVVTYNRKKLLMECITSLLNQSYKNNKILIVDNNSTDGTEEMLQEYINQNKINYFKCDENRGGSYGFHIGEKLAVQMGCDYIWLMDDDCVPTSDALEKLISAGERHQEFGYLASKVLWSDGNMCWMNIPKINISKKIKDYDKEQEICLSSFVSCLIREEVVEDVGLSMKDFFIWGDDWEYTWRISKKYKSFYIPDSIVIHKSKNNYGVNIAKAEKTELPRYKYAYRNESYFYHQAGIYGRIYLFLKIILHTFRVLFSKCDNKFTRLNYIYKYSRVGKRFHPSIIYTYNKERELNILEITADPIQYGGQEMFIMNMYKNFSNRKNHYAIATPYFNENANLKGLLRPGDEVLEGKKNEFSHFRKMEMMKWVKQILRKRKFDVIHIHSGSVYALLNISKEAKKQGVKTIIVHSHLGGKNNLKYRLIKRISDRKIEKYANVYFACSQLAAEWKFPKNIIDNKKFLIVNNGIDINKFTFSLEIRNKIRKELDLSDDFTFINVGRFESQKNHDFLLSLIPSIKSICPNYKFICIGAGSGKKDFVRKVTELNENEHFIFLENITNVNEYLFSADCFLLPSLHEGFPIALIEAEASGLPCIYSNLVTEEALLTDITTRLPLTDTSNWAEGISKAYNNRKEILKHRSEYSRKIEEKGYNEKISSAILENIYRGY